MRTDTKIKIYKTLTPEETAVDMKILGLALRNRGMNAGIRQRCVIEDVVMWMKCLEKEWGEYLDRMNGKNYRKS